MANFFDQFDAPASGNYFDQFDPIEPQSSVAQELTGIPKQVGAGIIEGAAAIPGAVPTALNQVGSAISDATGLPKPQPIINAPQTPDALLSSALPSPQSGAQEAARSLGPYAISAVQPGHLGENLAGAAGAAGGSYLGSWAAPYLGLNPAEGAVGGAIGGGLIGARSAGNKLNDIRRSNMPTPQEILSATSDSYDALRRANRSIVVPSDQMRLIKNGTLQLLADRGPAEEDAKSVYSIVNGLDADNGGTVADLINARKNLHAHFQGGPDANKPAASIALDVMDAMLGKIATPGTLAELKRNDANWSAARTAQAVDTKISQAQDRAEGANSGLNSGNNIIQNINAYIKSRTDITGKVHLAPSDLDALNSARKLNTGQQVGRYASNALAGGGGVGALLMAGLGGLGAKGANEAGYSATENDPILGGIALPALGLLGRYGFNRSVARAAKNAEASILARAPYVQSAGAPTPRPLLSLPQVAGRSLIFAAPALRDSLISSGQ